MLGAFPKPFLVLIPYAFEQLSKVIPVGFEEEFVETLIFLQDLNQSLLVLLAQLLFLIELLVQTVQVQLQVSNGLRLFLDALVEFSD